MKLDKELVFELLQHDDVKQFSIFIRDHWRNDHIFVKDTSVLYWQHKSSHAYHYMVAKHRNKVVGVHGVIPQVQFDEALPKNQIFLGLWKVLDTEFVGIGIALYQKILKEYDPKFIGVIGYNELILPFYKWQGFNTGLMDHHVVLSPSKKYKIAKVPVGIQPPKTKLLSDNISFELISQKDLLKLNTDNMYLHQWPLKSDTYIINRFINHPIYKYYVYAILHDDQLLALCVIRRILQDNSVVLRFVDFMGANEVFALLGKFVLSLLDEYKAEYLDIYSHGIPNDIIEKAGFLNRQEYDGLIIPNYFEPFERKNIDLRYAYKTTQTHDSIRLFKSDGDQDRPNMISR